MSTADTVAAQQHGRQEGTTGNGPGAQSTTGAHQQGPLQIERGVGFEANLNRFRVGCSCGQFRGCWYSQPQLAFASHARHASGQTVSFR